MVFEKVGYKIAVILNRKVWIEDRVKIEGLRLKSGILREARWRMEFKLQYLIELTISMILPVGANSLLSYFTNHPV